MARPRRGPITAGELLDQLEADPEWVRQRDEREAAHRASVEATWAALRPVRAELARAGVFSTTPSRQLFRTAEPIFIKWLARIADAHARLRIFDALALPAASREAKALLLREFVLEPPSGAPPGYRWHIGEAIRRAADTPMVDDLIRISKDPSWGKDRGMIIEALGRFRTSAASAALMELLDAGPDIARFAIIGLKRQKNLEAIPRLQELVDSPEKSTAKWAARALRVLLREKERCVARLKVASAADS